MTLDIHCNLKISRNRLGQVLQVNAERAERLAAQGDFSVAPEQQLSDIWHKALRNPGESNESEPPGQPMR